VQFVNAEWARQVTDICQLGTYLSRAGPVLVETDQDPMGGKVHPGREDSRELLEQVFDQPDTAGTTDTVDDQADFGTVSLLTDKALQVVVFKARSEGFFESPRLTVFALVKTAEAGTADDSVGTTAAVTAEPELLAFNLIDNQIGGRDGEIAMDAEIFIAHLFTGSAAAGG
jgi:hypothetical protein